MRCASATLAVMATIYVRVSADTKTYVGGVARDAGISEARAVEALLQRAKAECWIVEPITATVRPAADTDAE